MEMEMLDGESEAPLSQESLNHNAFQRNVRQKTDPAWEHCGQYVEDGKTILVCHYCDEVFRGINRFKMHLAGIEGQLCQKAPAYVCFEMKDKTGLKSNEEEKEKCDLAIAKWMIDASIPFSAVNSAYFQPMIDAICGMGQAYKGPSFYSVRGSLLSKLVDDTNKLVERYRSFWKQTGCTLMADEWIDHCGRTLINFMVYCPKGTVFLKSVDASPACETAELLYKLFREVVLYVGPENIVHIVTNNTPNHVDAGRLLEAEFPKLYWSPCAVHCINLMLQDIEKLEEVSETISQASEVTKYIYNHCYSLYLMRKYTGGREILHPAPTCFATNFIALQSILGQKDALRAMVTSKEWITSAYAREAKEKRIVEKVLDSRFWKRCVNIVKLTEPLVRVIRIADSEDKPAMGFLYQAIYKAREDMVRRFERNKEMVEPYLMILDKHWDSQLRKNLHAASYWLNPSCHFNDKVSEKNITQSSFLDVIERYALEDQELRSKLTRDAIKFMHSEEDFGREIALCDRSVGKPGDWWKSYGCDAPDLQKLAIRVLSQTCSASGCERNRRLFEHIHSNKRNRLEHQRLTDVVFVHYNLRLQQRNRLRQQNYDPINFETLDDYSNWVLEESPRFLTTEEVESLRNDLANMTTQPVLDNTDQLNLDEDDDAPDNTMENGNQNESDIWEASNFFTPWI